jgi:hypothetical protein
MLPCFDLAMGDMETAWLVIPVFGAARQLIKTQSA